MEPSLDAAALKQLASSGSDLSKLHQIDFLLRLPSEKAAQRAELQLIELAFATRIEHAGTGTSWELHGVKRMYPIEADLLGLRDKLDVIAAEGKGSYEGWRARVAK